MHNKNMQKVDLTCDQCARIAFCGFMVMSTASKTSLMNLHVQSTIKCVDQPADSHDISAVSFEKSKLQQND